MPEGLDRIEVWANIISQSNKFKNGFPGKAKRYLIRPLGNLGSLGYCKKRNTKCWKHIYNYVLWHIESAEDNLATPYSPRKPGFEAENTGELQSNVHGIAMPWIPSHSGLLINEKYKLKELKDYLSIGVHLHISRTAWLMYATWKTQVLQDKDTRKGSLSSLSLCSLNKDCY